MAEPTTAEFAKAVRRSFSFLVSEYGFAETDMYSIPFATFPRGRERIQADQAVVIVDRAVFAEFMSRTGSVHVIYDPRGEVQVTVASHRLPEQGADLYHILKSQGVPNTPNGWLYAWGETSVSEALDALAGALSSYGRKFLKDDAAAWEQLWKWRTSGQDR